jgi:hypothetical protein
MSKNNYEVPVHKYLGTLPQDTELHNTPFGGTGVRYDLASSQMKFSEQLTVLKMHDGFRKKKNPMSNFSWSSHSRVDSGDSHLKCGSCYKYRYENFFFFFVTIGSVSYGCC